jgi:hypothetical protein
MHTKALIAAGILVAGAALAGCNQSKSADSMATPENDASPVPAPEPSEDVMKSPPVRGDDGQYEPAAFLMSSGIYSNKAAYVTLKGTGPNKSKIFFVEYTASIGYNFHEYKKGFKRHCGWNFPPPNKIDRVLYVETTPPNVKVVATAGTTRGAPGGGDTQDNCWNVWNNIIQRQLIEQTSNQSWKSWIDQDMIEVNKIIANPLP